LFSIIRKFPVLQRNHTGEKFDKWNFFLGFMEFPLIEQFGQVEHSISVTIFFGPVEVPVIESTLYIQYDNIK